MGKLSKSLKEKLELLEQHENSITNEISKLSQDTQKLKEQTKDCEDLTSILNNYIASGMATMAPTATLADLKTHLLSGLKDNKEVKDALEKAKLLVQNFGKEDHHNE